MADSLFGQFHRNMRICFREGVCNAGRWCVHSDFQNGHDAEVQFMASEVVSLRLQCFVQIHDLQSISRKQDSSGSRLQYLVGSVKDAAAWWLTYNAGVGADESATLLPEYNNSLS